MEPGAPAGYDVAHRVLDAHRAGVWPLVLVLQREPEHGAVRGLRSGAVGPDAGPVAAADALDGSSALVPHALSIDGALDGKPGAAARVRGLGQATRSRALETAGTPTKNSMLRGVPTIFAWPYCHE